MSNFASLAEHRRDPRFEKDAGVKLFNGRMPVFEPSLVDISLSGMGLQLADEAVPGQALRFTLELPQGRVSGRAIVRWSHPHHLGWRCGVELVDMGWSDRRRLRFFLDPDYCDWLRVLDILLVLAAGAA
ncbi:MAG TPA: hypothetical protein DCM05_12005, partial [Elusimicrobia bacterium]|nr:hypothetical protein [Elusimicrobiota bacterium]